MGVIRRDYKSKVYAFFKGKIKWSFKNI
jgi:hypothetical protein